MAKLTPWFCAVTQRPSRIGWYEIKWGNMMPIERLFFNGEAWYRKFEYIEHETNFGTYISWNDKWRGLAEEPK